MKRILIVMFSIGILFVISCQKTDNVSSSEKSEAEVIFSQADFRDPVAIENHLTNFHTAIDSKAPGWWKKFKKWVKAHTGTHLFENCQGDHPCGPCPGMCINIDAPIVVPIEYELTGADSTAGYSLLILHEYEDSLMVISFIDSSYFVHNGYFYLQADWDLGEAIADTFDQPQIVVQSGVYPIVTSYHSQGETVVDIEN